jgi:Protein of unknown function (DUF2971)
VPCAHERPNNARDIIEKIQAGEYCFQAVAIIQSYVRPLALYRYRSLKKIERELEAIEHKFLYCAAYDTLNDPMEGLFRSTLLLRMSHDYGSIRDSIITNKARIGICSFSEIHNHGPMWAHYADEFRGICIEYSLSTLLDTMARDVTFVRMFYNETVPAVSLSDPEPAKMVLSYKNYRWLYEREWRMFGPLGMVSYADAECVTGVYLGSRMRDAHRKRITDMLGRLKIPAHDMTIDQYSIGFEASS